MTKEEIMDMARQAGMLRDGDVWFSANNYEQCDVHIAELEAFAKLVAAKEREEFMGRLVKNPSIVRQIIDAVLLASHPGGLKKRKTT